MWYEQARQLDEAAGHQLWLAGDLHNLGVVARDRGELAAAEDYHRSALAIYERLAPNGLGVAASLSKVGSDAYDRGDLAAAQDYYSRDLAIRERQTPDSLAAAASLIGLGGVAQSRGDLAAAQVYPKIRYLPNTPEPGKPPAAPELARGRLQTTL